MIEQFEEDIRSLIAAGLKNLKSVADANDGALDEKSVKTLEVLNKCVSEILKRPKVSPTNPLTLLSDEELESEF